MARFVRVAKEHLVEREAWAQLEQAHPALLTDVIEGRSIEWSAVDSAEHPSLGTGAARRVVLQQEQAFIQS